VAGDLFAQAAADAAEAAAPLAARMRPRSLDEVVGQEHLLGAGAPLRRLVDGGVGTSVLLWGPPGSGKTTIARLLAAGRLFVELSAVTAGVKDVRAAIEAAKERLSFHSERTVLFVDEVHRFSKSQ
jgi:putative ATPase